MLLLDADLSHSFLQGNRVASSGEIEGTAHAQSPVEVHRAQARQDDESPRSEELVATILIMPNAAVPVLRNAPFQPVGEGVAIPEETIVTIKNKK
jgi:hypothetical protein